MFAARVLTLSLLTTLAGAAHAEPLDLTVEATEGVTANGCANGTFDWTISQDNQYLQIRYYDFAVDSYMGRGYDEKTCLLTLNARVPMGYTVAIDAVQLRGHVSVSDQNGTGSMEASYTTDPFARYPTALLSTPFRGPYEIDFSVNGNPTARDMQWTACDGFQDKRIDLATRLAVRSDSFGTSAISNHSMDNAIVQTYRFRWARCPNNPGPGPGPGPGDWYGTCRVVLETVWGQDLQDFWGQSQSRSQQDAINRARQDGQSQCERARGSDGLKRCTVVDNACTATRR